MFEPVDLGCLTCRCRFCGNILSYARHDIGTDARCPTCGQVVRLPGPLQKVGTIERRRSWDPLGTSMEVAGFVLMFFLFPWGFAAGIVLLILGWRRCNKLVCSGYARPLPHSRLERCPHCRASFSSD